VADLKASETRDENGLLPQRASRWPRSPRRVGSLGASASGPDSLRARARAMAAGVTPAALWRDHRLFTVLVLLAVAVRVLVTLAFQPALFIADSFGYMYNGVHLAVGQLRPAGYSMLLRVLEPFHSLLLVTTLQHLMGIGTAIIVYGLLRYWGLPAWGAALATVPTLFDARQLALESYILPDAVFGFVTLVAVALLLTKRTPTIWRCVVAGLLVAWASVLRGNGAPIMLALFAFMLIRRVGWRALSAGAAAFAIPLVAYASLFAATFGQFDITNSTGLFLWSRTMSFANCSVIKPPPDLRPLCPDRQGLRARPVTAWSVSSLLNERTPGEYLWSGDAWWRHDAHPGINAYNNRLGMRFALDAIKAQPLSYLRVTAQGVLLTFLATDRADNYLSLNFTAGPVVPVPLSASYLSHLRAYAHTTSDTHLVQPYAYYTYLYQLPVWFPGVAFFVVMVIGLGGVLRQWRRWGGPAALPWAVAVIGLVVPIAVAQYLYRYAITAVPLACLAAGLAFARLDGVQWPGLQRAAGQRPAAQQPPALQPSTAQPPGAQPPAAQPPGAQPPAAQPPGAQPPAAQPPGAQPSTAQPPAAQPSTAQPPAAQPSTAQPPAAGPDPAG
jgi:hypothetical protein